jgi:hypothetical protein
MAFKFALSVSALALGAAFTVAPALAQGTNAPNADNQQQTGPQSGMQTGTPESRQLKSSRHPKSTSSRRLVRRQVARSAPRNNTYNYAYAPGGGFTPGYSDEPNITNRTYGAGPAFAGTPFYTGGYGYGRGYYGYAPGYGYGRGYYGSAPGSAFGYGYYGY